MAVVTITIQADAVKITPNIKRGFIDLEIEGVSVSELVEQVDDDDQFLDIIGMTAAMEKWGLVEPGKE